MVDPRVIRLKFMQPTQYYNCMHQLPWVWALLIPTSVATQQLSLETPRQTCAVGESLPVSAILALQSRPSSMFALCESTRQGNAWVTMPLAVIFGIEGYVAGWDEQLLYQ